jgi:pimeloyl-ACP methyl ester carboxylesterase
VAVRAPLAEGSGFAWFANRGVGRPVTESLKETMRWFRDWMKDVAPATRPVILVGFSGGAAFAGGLLLDDPERYAGGAILYGTLPFGLACPHLRTGSVDWVQRRQPPARLEDTALFVLMSPRYRPGLVPCCTGARHPINKPHL